MRNVLFVCIHNAGRSQMSQALLARRAPDRYESRSAGTAPAERVQAEVIEVMREIGVDLSDRTPQLLSEELTGWAEVVVTMGCGDACPFVPGVRYLEWDLPDPKGRSLQDVRLLRDEISERIGRLVETLDAEVGGGAPD